MSRNRVVMCAIGGCAVAAAGVVGFLLNGAMAEKAEIEEMLDVKKTEVQRLRGAKVSPTQASVNAVVSNRTALADWREEAFDAAAVGDFKADASASGAGFRQTMFDDATVFSKLKGSEGAPFVKEGFGFGFENYIRKGEIPAQEKLAKLQRQWSDVKGIVETLAACGVSELTGIAVATPAPPPPDAKPASGARNNRNKPKAEEGPKVSEETYAVTFVARAPALVRVLNALATDARFTAVESPAFGRDRDALGEVLGKKEGGEAKAGGERRSRRRRGAAAEEDAKKAEEPELKQGIVTDPEADAPFAVSMKVVTVDFGSAAAKAESVAKEVAE